MDRPFGSLPRRTAAGLVDLVLIAVGGLAIIGLLGRSADVQFVVHVLQAAYWILLQSPAGGGQSVGKRLFGLRVISLDGTLPTIGASAWRWFVAVGCAEPAMVAWGRLGGNAAPSALSTAVILTVPPVFAMFADTYLILANRTTRRSFHDLVSGTVVVRADHQGAVDVEPLGGVHRAVVAAMAIALLVAVPPAARMVAALGPRTLELMDATTTLRSDPRVTSLGVVPTLSVTGRDTAWTVYVIAGLRVPHDSVAQQDSAARALACSFAMHAPRAARSAILDMDLVFSSAADAKHYAASYLASTELVTARCDSLLRAYPLPAPAARAAP